MKYPHLQALRYANWARRSDLLEDNSIDDQLATNNSFANDHEMSWVKDFVLDGTGSVPGARTDIPEVIKECVDNQIEVLLLHDVSRLTRSGIEHGMKVLYDIKSEGIEAVFVRDDIPGGEWAPLFQTLLLFAANQYSRKLADASARSWQIALEANRIPVSKMTPYGLDRLVLGPDGEPAFRIRNYEGQIQKKLHVTDDENVLETYCKTEDGKRSFYSKQKTETVYLIPGEKTRADTVRLMFHRYYMEGVPFNQIRKELNTRGIPSPKGGKWSKRTVSQIIRNPIYTGKGLANSYSAAIYVMRNHGQPVPTKHNLKTLSKTKRPRASRRPERDWFWRDEPYLKDFLQSDLKIVAEEHQRNHLDKIKEGRKPKPGGDAHADSPYILKRRLVTKDGRRLVGSGGRRRTRYYAVEHVDGVKRKMVPAVPIEQCVLQLVREIISAEDSIRKSVLNYVKQETASISELERNSQYLRDEQEKLECKIGYLYDRVTTPASKAVTEKKIAEVEMQLTTVNKQLKKAQGEYPAALRDAEGAADAVVKQLAAIGQDLDSQSVSSLHKLLDHLIEKIEIDIEKSEIDLSFRLPHTSVWTAFEISRNGCAVPKADPMCRNSTNTGNSLYLADYHCKQEGNTQNHCWKCSRKMYMRMATGAIAA
jgi:hypothetical protein